MASIIQPAHQRNTECIYRSEYPINGRESLRIELWQRRARVTADIRRWREQPDGTARSTKKGFAVSVNHLPAIIDLLSAALAKVTATTATANNEPTKTATPPQSVSGGV
jgi:hypothetical protein